MRPKIWFGSLQRSPLLAVMTTIYLDLCCCHRSFDDHSIDRNRQEAEAVDTILRGFVATGRCRWLASEILQVESLAGSDPARRNHLDQLLLQHATAIIALDAEIRSMAVEYQRIGRLDPFDSLHLASAIAGGALVFLTTDDKLTRRAARLNLPQSFRVLNPVDFVGALCPET